MAVGLAGAGVELQGLVGFVTAGIGDAGLDLLGVIAADAGQVGWVGSVAGRGWLVSRSANSGTSENDSPNDRQKAGGGLVGGDEAGEGNKGQGECRLLEEHVDGIVGNKRIDESWID